MGNLNLLQVATDEKSSAVLIPCLTLLLTPPTPKHWWTGESLPATEGLLYQALFQGGLGQTHHNGGLGDLNPVCFG